MDKAVQKTVAFIVSVFVFVGLFGFLDMQTKISENETFVSSLTKNPELSEVLGFGYKVVDVKEKGSKVYPEITAELEMYGFTILADFKDKELETVNLIVACEEGAVAGSKVCYSQTLYPAQSAINYMK